jgi:hypothetical protein
MADDNPYRDDEAGEEEEEIDETVCEILPLSRRYALNRALRATKQ